MLKFRSSEVLSTSSLCIHPGRAAWVLYVDAICLNYDGNAFDAALLAMIAALKNSKLVAHNARPYVNDFLLSAKLPKATFDEETGRITCSRSDSVSLDIRRSPSSASFGIFDSCVVLLMQRSFVLIMY